MPTRAKPPDALYQISLSSNLKDSVTMADLSKLVDQLSSLTVLEAAELAKLLEEKWGVSAAAAIAVAAPGGGGAAAAPVEEKTEFTVVLAGGAGKDTAGIQEVR